MKVKKIMTRSVGFCREKDNLTKAVSVMWKKDCGIVPIVDKKSKVVGTVTDRDVSVSVFLQNKPASNVLVGDIMSKKVKTCSSKNEVKDVLKTMEKHQIKRLPVVKKNGKLEGIISITDIMLASKNDRALRRKLLKTLEAISKPHPIVLKEVKNQDDRRRAF